MDRPLTLACGIVDALAASKANGDTHSFTEEFPLGLGDIAYSWDDSVFV